MDAPASEEPDEVSAVLYRANSVCISARVNPAYGPERTRPVALDMVGGWMVKRESRTGWLTRTRLCGKWGCQVGAAHQLVAQFRRFGMGTLLGTAAVAIGR
jgi:hypothetical protein